MEDLRPTISVVLAVYNGERYLREAIDSVLRQSFADFELLIINDGSSDGSAAILRAAAERDARVRVLTNEQNLGLIASLNRGLDEARGRYIARMDADDVALPERFATQIRFLETHPDIALVGSQVEIMDADGRTTGRSHVPLTNDAVHRELAQRNCMYHSSILFRANEGIRYQAKMVHVEDYDVYLRLLTAGKKIANVDAVLMRYRLSSSSISLTQRAKQALMADVARSMYAERCARGTDSYATFDPTGIVSINTETTTDARILRTQIAGLFRAHDVRAVRRLCMRFFRHHGMLSRVTVYYIASFLPARVIDALRSLRPRS